jgi:hypothetical protein
MNDVHGAQAAVVARGNARNAALAGQTTQAKSWIAVLAMIQRQQTGKASSTRGPDNPLLAKSAKG